jgi:hypothetical protein
MLAPPSEIPSNDTVVRKGASGAESAPRISQVEAAKAKPVSRRFRMDLIRAGLAVL